MGHENVAVSRWRRLRLARGRRLTFAVIGVALALFVSAVPPAAMAAESSSATPVPDRLWERYAAEDREGSGADAGATGAPAAAGGSGESAADGPGTLTFAAIALAALALVAIVAAVAVPRRRGRRRPTPAVPPDAKGAAPRVARAAPIPAVRAPKPARSRRGGPDEPRRRGRRPAAEPDAPRFRPPPAEAGGPRRQPSPATEPGGAPTQPGAPRPQPSPATGPGGAPTRPAGEPTRPSPGAEPSRPAPEPSPIPAPAAQSAPPQQPPAPPEERPAPAADPTPEPFAWPQTERRLRPRITPPSRPNLEPRARPRTERRLRPRLEPTAGPAPTAEPTEAEIPVPRRRPLPADRAAERRALYEREFSRQVDTTQELRERITDLLAPGRDIQEATELLRTGRKPMVRPQREGGATAAPKAPHDEDRACEIVVWRGRSRAQFHAVIPAAEGEGRWVGESPPFRWPRSRPMEPEGEALAAHTALVRALTRAGWEPDGQGDDWFSGTFRRVQTAPAPERS
jgi:hypothetical protein